MSLVSIIIPTYNRAHLIGATLESILAQTYINWECIIVDDGSTDNTNEVVNNYVIKDSRFRYHKRPERIRKGANACRNYGFEISKGEFINWFDSDDVMLDDFIKEKVSCFYDSINLVICSGYSADNQLNVINNIDLTLKSELFKDYIIWNLKVFTPSVLFRKKFLLKFELFNIEYHRGQETELFSRLFYEIKKNEYIIINKPLFKYRQHQESKTYRNKKYVKRYIKSLTQNSITNLNRGVILKDVEIIQFHYNLLLNYFFGGISNGDKANSFFIIKEVFKSLNRLNLYKGLKFFIIAIIIFFGIGRTKLKNVLKNIIQF